MVFLFVVVVLFSSSTSCEDPFRNLIETQLTLLVFRAWLFSLCYLGANIVVPIQKLLLLSIFVLCKWVFVGLLLIFRAVFRELRFSCMQVKHLTAMSFHLDCGDELKSETSKDDASKDWTSMAELEAARVKMQPEGRGPKKPRWGKKAEAAWDFGEWGDVAQAGALYVPMH